MEGRWSRFFPRKSVFHFFCQKDFHSFKRDGMWMHFLRLMHIFTWNLILGGLSGCKEFRLYQNVSSSSSSVVRLFLCWDLCRSRDLFFFFVNGGLTLPSQMMRRWYYLQKKGGKNRWNAAINFFLGQILNAIPKAKGCNYNDSFFPLKFCYFRQHHWCEKDNCGDGGSNQMKSINALEPFSNYNKISSHVYF